MEVSCQSAAERVPVAPEQTQRCTEAGTDQNCRGDTAPRSDSAYLQLRKISRGGDPGRREETESLLLSLVGVAVPAFLLRAHAQFGFMECNAIRNRGPVIGESTFVGILGASHRPVAGVSWLPAFCPNRVATAKVERLKNAQQN
jgi:hypothetical protein